MTRRTSAAVVIGMVLASLGLLHEPAGASTPVWTITEVTGPSQLIIRGGGTKAVFAACPNGQTPISGSVNASAPDDVRRLTESYGFGSGTAYNVNLVDFTDGTSTITVSATVRCVATGSFGLSTTVANSFGASGNLAQGTVLCPTDFVALHGSVSYGGTGDRTLLTSSPTFARTGWEARAYLTSGNMTLTVRCVPAADMANAKAYSHSDAVGWGAGASATCAAGLVPIIGGTVHVGGDSGAITIFPKATATGWTSTTLSLSTGNMQTTVICMPGGYPSVTFAASAASTNVDSVSWTFTATDPAAAGGYSMGATCQFSHLGVISSTAPCTSPINLTGLADGVHSVLTTATTSDGRSAAASKFVTVDTVAPDVTYADASGQVYGTSSPTIGFTVADATSPVTTKPACWVDAGAQVPCVVPDFGDYRRTLSVTLTGLSQGSHTLHVKPTDAVTNTETYDLAFVVDTTAPSVVFDDAPGVEHGTALPTFGFTVADATAVGTLQCWLDGAVAAPCAVPVAADYRGHRSLSLSGVGDGAHTLHVRPTDAGANAATSDLGFVVDTAAPTVTMSQPTSPFQLALSTTAAWSGSDAGTGVQSFGLRTSSAPYNGPFSAWSATTSVTASTTSNTYGSLVPGTTYCYSAQAIDGVGHASAFATSCTAVPLDDRSLKASKGWKTTTSGGLFQGTGISTKTRGKSLTVGATAQRIALVAQTCPKCGKVAVFIGSTKVAKVSLKSSSKAVRMFTLPAFSLRTGTVKIKVLTDGKLVLVDALGLTAS